MFASKRQTAVRSPRSNSSTPSCPFALTVRAKPKLHNQPRLPAGPSEVRPRPPFVFVPDQRSRPNTPAFTSKPQAAVRAHRSSSFAPRVRDQTRPAFTPVHVRLSDLPRPSAASVQVRSRPEVTTKPAQRSLPSASSVYVHRSRSFTTRGHDQTRPASTTRLRFRPRRPGPLPRRSTRPGHTCGANI